MASPQFPPLLLKNDKMNRNMCSLNSNLQLLRHIPEFQSEMVKFRRISPLMDALIHILARTGTYEHLSASTLRKCLAEFTNIPDLNSGSQHDTVELLNFLLNCIPNSLNDLFSFESTLQYRFHIDAHSSPCPTCGQWPKAVTAKDKILKVALPRSTSSIHLDSLLKRHFSVQHQSEGRSCSSCLEKNSDSPKYPYMEKGCLSKSPKYLLI